MGFHSHLDLALAGIIAQLPGEVEGRLIPGTHYIQPQIRAFFA
jgi:hypothetical protein